MEQPLTQRNNICAEPLSEGTSLRHRYSVRMPIGADSCTLTYDGFDYVARQPVTIVEFFPASIAIRELGVMTVSPSGKENGELFFVGMEAFYRQYGKLLPSIGSPNVLSIFDVFFENGTAYAVAERPEGMTLSAYLDMRGRGLSDGEVAYIVRALADAFLVVHSCNTLHHGISADTILLCTDGTVKLIDFAAGRMTVEEGRAQRDDEPWKDYRALGRTLYQAYSGTSDFDALERLDAAIPQPLLTLFTGMLSDEPTLRFGSVFDLRYTADNLQIAPVRPAVTAESLAAYRARPKRPVTTAAKRVQNAGEKAREKIAPVGSWWIAAAIGCTILALLGILLFALLRR